MRKTAIVLIASALLAGTAVAADAPQQKPAAAKRFVHPKFENCHHEAHEHMGYGMGGYGMMGHQGGMMGGSDVKMLGPRTAIVLSLPLTAEQRASINKLTDKLQHDNWATMGTIMDDTGVLRDLYQAERRDPVAIDKTYQRIFDLKRQMIKGALDTENQIEDLLTPDQLKEFRARLQQQVR
ncbi:MAG: hypothetical protein HKL98_08695 [Burkholderiales bacterium]|nr:hypothetical protein [Burkholderiales bacterium]